jgi:uncharacterized repeat protein (TIGR03843 family)
VSSKSLAVGDILTLLSTGEVEVLGLLPYSSNYVFLTRVSSGSENALAIYKPTKGERPLWDFPAGTLAAREVAAFELSEAAGWHFVPPTVLRDDAPMGPGSLQLFIDHDPERHYFVLFEERPADFADFAAFDVVVNNADRKGGHVLEDRENRLWAVDHGLTFNVAPKLRTVIWDLAGHTLEDGLIARLDDLKAALDDESDLGRRLAELLNFDEVAATRERTERLSEARVFPHPDHDRHLPWPLV